MQLLVSIDVSSLMGAGLPITLMPNKVPGTDLYWYWVDVADSNRLVGLEDESCVLRRWQPVSLYVR